MIRGLRNFVALIIGCMGCGLIMASACRQSIEMTVIGLVVFGVGYMLAD